MDGYARDQERVKVVDRWMDTLESKRGLKLSTDGWIWLGIKRGLKLLTDRWIR